MENLYERAVTLQQQLDDFNRQSQLLFDTMDSEVREQSFYSYVSRVKTGDNIEDFYQHCL